MTFQGFPGPVSRFDEPEPRTKASHICLLQALHKARFFGNSEHKSFTFNTGPYFFSVRSDPDPITVNIGDGKPVVNYGT